MKRYLRRRTVWRQHGAVDQNRPRGADERRANKPGSPWSCFPFKRVRNGAQPDHVVQPAPALAPSIGDLKQGPAQSCLRLRQVFHSEAQQLSGSQCAGGRAIRQTGPEQPDLQHQTMGGVGPAFAGCDAQIVLQCAKFLRQQNDWVHPHARHLAVRCHHANAGNDRMEPRHMQMFDFYPNAPQAAVTMNPARGKCTATSPTKGSFRRMAISCALENMISPATGSRP